MDNFNINNKILFEQFQPKNRNLLTKQLPFFCQLWSAQKLLLLVSELIQSHLSSPVKQNLWGLIIHNVIPHLTTFKRNNKLLGNLTENARMGICLHVHVKVTVHIRHSDRLCYEKKKKRNFPNSDYALWKKNSVTNNMLI